MSSLTQRLRALPGYLPAFLRRQPELVDAEFEMRKACEIARALRPLDPTSRIRVLKHAWAIEQDNQQRIAAFYGEDIPAAARIDDSHYA
ncbi:MAG TPA: hypothetical protein PK857_00390 [Hyphomicrobium sp.]|nr:hypothetical protein [Hyphomicrobium sp.]HRO48802.1 hypothetical protein [Hyphomicrobium sp.]